MIVFSQYQNTFAGLKQTVNLFKERVKAFSDLILTEELYIFGVSNTKEADIYISPNLQKSPQVLQQILSEKFGQLLIVVGTVGNPPQRNWLGITPRARVKSITDCARLSVFTELYINNKIIT